MLYTLNSHLSSLGNNETDDPMDGTGGVTSNGALESLKSSIENIKQAHAKRSKS